MITVKTISQYFSEKKNDLLILQFVGRGPDHLDFSDMDQDVLDWLGSQDISYEKTVPDTVLSGWLGHYYVDFSGAYDPRLASYSAEFENKDGTSLKSDKYQMYVYYYEDWISKLNRDLDRPEHDDY